MWIGMRNRCNNFKASDYKYYGGKGVTICSEWNDFAVFREWAMTHGYLDSLTIERKDSAGNYEAGNCEFITQSENSKRGNAHRWRLRLVG
jgi:hypothetical protein